MDPDSRRAQAVIHAAVDDNGVEQQDDQEAVAATLAERVGIDLSDESAVAASFDNAETDWRRLTAECMLAEGFEYSQEDWSSPGALPTLGRGTTRHYAEQYGFGVVAAFLVATYDPDASYEAPNSAHISTLTATERDAYFIALVGNPEGENRR